MSELKSTGTIVRFLEKKEGTTKAGSAWVKQSFVIDTKAQYDNLQCFEVFGLEKVDNLTKYNKVGDDVTVQFNIKCNEYNGQYYTTLGAFRIDKVVTGEY